MSHSRWTLVAGLLALLAPGAARAAEDYEPIGEGITLGRFVLHPSMVFQFMEDTNIYFTSADFPGAEPTASGIMTVGPRIFVDLPLGESRIRWVYAPYYRQYTESGLERGLNHLFDMDALFQPGRLFTFRLRDHYTKGTTTLSNPTNGLSYGLGNYTSHNPSLEIGLNLGIRHGISVIPSYGKSLFIQAGPTPFSSDREYGFDTRRLEGRYNYRISEPTTLYAYSAAEHTLQTQTRRDDVDIDTRSTGVGLTRMANEKVTTTISAGFETMNFTGTKGKDFRGPVFDAGLNWLISDGTRVEVGALRQAFASVYFDTNYYVANEVRGRLTRQLRLNSYWDAGARLTDEMYVPATGPNRRDGAVRLEGGIGHQFLRNLRGYFGTNIEYHQSNVRDVIGGQEVDPFHYRVVRFVFRMEVGWL